MPLNWFDLLIVITLFVGLQRGRKHGMSEELIIVLKWICIVVFCGFTYQPLGTLLANSPAFSLLDGYIVAYLGCALLVAAAFALLKKMLGEKWISSETFGRSEFYLGMVAGMIRWTCMLIAVLAILNARLYRQEEVRADIRYQNDVYGSTFFPKLYTLQAQVFKSSLMGPWIKNNLSFALIQPTPPSKKELKRKELDM